MNKIADIMTKIIVFICSAKMISVVIGVSMVIVIICAFIYLFVSPQSRGDKFPAPKDYDYWNKNHEQTRFDCQGVLRAIYEVEKIHRLPLPKTFHDLGFCQVCLGANKPEQKSYPPNAWRCGAWCDSLLPAWKICENFQLDNEKLAQLTNDLRPRENEKSYSQNI